MPAAVAHPVDAQSMAAHLAEAQAAPRRIVPIGGGTKAAWHHDPFTDTAAVSTLGLTNGFAHYAGDLVATIPAGLTLAAANSRLAAAGQWLPLDAPYAERATIGGVVACNDSGPRRHRFGAVRDLIIGIEVALSDGRVVCAGGRVVKNVAGYDLSRLFCGSSGSLGIITSATFKLAPLATASRTVVLHFDTMRAALDGAQTLAHASITPSAVELQGPTAALLVRFDTTPTAAEHMAEVTRRLLCGATDGTLLTGDDESAAWRAHERLLWPPDGDVVVKISVLPTAAAATIEAASTRGTLRAVIGRAALGVLYLRLHGDATTVAASIESARRAAADGRGHLAVLEAPAGLRERLAPHPAAAAPLMHEIKRRFDPQGVLRRVPDGL